MRSEQAAGARLFFSRLGEVSSGSSATSVCLAPAVPPAPNPDSNLLAFSYGASLLLRHGHRHALVGEGLREASGAARERFYLPGRSPSVRILPVSEGSGRRRLGQASPPPLCTGISFCPDFPHRRFVLAVVFTRRSHLFGQIVSP